MCIGYIQILCHLYKGLEHPREDCMCVLTSALFLNLCPQPLFSQGIRMLGVCVMMYKSS